MFYLSFSLINVDNISFLSAILLKGQYFEKRFRGGNTYRQGNVVNRQSCVTSVYFTCYVYGTLMVI